MYSVGEDGRDDGGKYQYTDYGNVNPYEPDISFFLSGEPPEQDRKKR